MIKEGLDKADYWTRTAWKQLLPFHLEKTTYREEARINPFLTERELVERPKEHKHYAVRMAWIAAFDVLITRQEKKNETQ